MRVILIAVLVGCAPKIIASTPRSVFVNSHRDEIGAATRMAQKHCEQYERDAEFQEQDRDGAHFKCVDRRPEPPPGPRGED